MVFPYEANKLMMMILSFTPMVMLAEPPLNLDSLKKEIIHYHESGEYDVDISKVTHLAKRYLADRIRENQHASHPKKLAMVLDIDETSLSNYSDIKVLNFGGTFLQQDLAEADGDDPAITPTLNLYRYAIQHGVAVFFITGRQEKYRTATIKNLKTAGYSQWARLYMKPNDYRLNSAAPYKISERKAIEKEGYDIVLNMGDQYSDLKGGYSEHSYKLPNFMYYIP
ncbi:HAD family acid phosphatase [Coxiella burnetii]|nr:HAD family acid phosphatase [Coxiella burnetii]ABX79071.1 putative acid phosphatase [Coxiella burnetii RSA 331]AML49679.1 acid phosphatase [Coxiella burnetii]ATN69559.1 acid phosphatase [Coxiella burnetii]ATN71481.1 acid phosphatase [Coxiella burnetii]ATN73372.1 acid phosphatase [Coxiella burnetii]